MIFGQTLSEIFGGSGWLRRAPGGQYFDLVAGRTTGPAGTFIRSASSGLWIAAS